MERPIMTFQKRADVEKNRIIIPKAIIDNWGRMFYMEVYSDKIVLKPLKEEGE